MNAEFDLKYSKTNQDTLGLTESNALLSIQVTTELTSSQSRCFLSSILFVDEISLIELFPSIFGRTLHQVTDLRDLLHLLISSKLNIALTLRYILKLSSNWYNDATFYKQECLGMNDPWNGIKEFMIMALSHPGNSKVHYFNEYLKELAKNYQISLKEYIDGQNVSYSLPLGCFIYKLSLVTKVKNNNGLLNLIMDDFLRDLKNDEYPFQKKSKIFLIIACLIDEKCFFQNTELKGILDLGVTLLDRDAETVSDTLRMFFKIISAGLLNEFPEARKELFKQIPMLIGSEEDNVLENILRLLYDLICADLFHELSNEIKAEIFEQIPALLDSAEGNVLFHLIKLNYKLVDFFDELPEKTQTAIFEHIPKILAHEDDDIVQETTKLICKLINFGLVDEILDKTETAIFKEIPRLLLRKNDHWGNDDYYEKLVTMISMFIKLDLFDEFPEEAKVAVFKEIPTLLDHFDEATVNATILMICELILADLMNELPVEAISKKIPSFLNHTNEVIVTHTMFVICEFANARLFKAFHIETQNAIFKNIRVFFKHSNEMIATYSIALMKILLANKTISLNGV